MVSIGGTLALLVVVALVASVAVVGRLDRERAARVGDAVRARLVMGVPWGTLVVMGFVLAVYLFVQDGITDWHDPVVLPYRAWSYFYPLGMLTGSFSHADAGHLTGNLVGTLAAAPIAEYAWGHYPRKRGSEAFSTWKTNPWLRALVVFPGVVIAVGLATSLFAVGPVIGFSGVVYAFAGFAVVRYPLATLLSTTVLQSALFTIYRGVWTPVLEVTAQPSPPSAPSWATVAIQGHAVGLLIGFLLGLWLFRRRGELPSPGRLWIGLLLFGFARSFWAIYWFRGGETYVLYRGLGVVVVAWLAIVLAVAAVGPERPLLGRWSPGDSAGQVAASSADGGRDRSRSASERLREAIAGRGPDGSLRGTIASASPRGAALVVVLVLLGAMAGPAIPVNAFVVSGDTGDAGEEGTLAVEDYSITYAEGVENRLVGAVDIGPLESATTVETGGVIVSSSERQIWTDAVPAGELAFAGRSTVVVGGPGWRESVTATRAGWTATGGETAYQVWLAPAGGEPQHAFASGPARAALTLAGHDVSIVPEGGEFRVAIEGEVNATAELPEPGESVTLGPVTFEREGSGLYGAVEGTRVQVASAETYGELE
ncbi:rhomboid family intramembrane serine protease [Saliphagus sp. LR7]|uniref:rhomboid family intramembrane serine protease n=1 Tax=Saliphagus sp. LR7 TaxID=2282654 RepID=UPI000DF85511|nr:rhomboid family intramembrane serine protease [Saliphagus sp. LR7]